MKGVIIGSILLVLLAGCGENKEQKEPAPAVSDTTALINHGKEMFAINCANCHMVNQDLTAPALAGVQSRWSDKKLLYRYIHNSQEVIKENEYAMNLFKKWNGTMMNPFPNLTDNDITAILKYIEVNAKPAP